MKIVTGLRQAWLHASVACYLWLQHSPASAYIPKLNKNKNDDLLGYSVDTIKVFLKLAILIVAAIIFLSVAYHILIKFAEWRKQKAEFGDFMNSLAIGSVVVLIGGFMLFTALKMVNSFTV